MIYISAWFAIATPLAGFRLSGALGMNKSLTSNYHHPVALFNSLLNFLLNIRGWRMLVLFGF